MGSLRGALKRSRALIIATMLARDARLAASGRLRPGRAVRLGARHDGFSLEQSLEYIEGVVADYETDGGLGRAALEGARVLELGPGDNLGVALCLLARGAERVVCLDRFVTWRDPDQQRRIHLALADRMDGEDRARIEGVLDEDGSISSATDRLVLVEGTGVEAAEGVVGAERVDAVVSRAVLAHVWDLGEAFDAMDRTLVRGGLMAHKVDLSDHRLFSDAGHNPLTFLTVPDRIYDRMRRHTGLTNRALIGRYRSELEGRGYEAELLPTKLMGPEPIAEIRPDLLERFRALPDEDLAVAGIFIRARKPA